MIVTLDSIPTRGLAVPVGPWAAAGAAEALGGEVRQLAGELRLTRHDAHIAVRGELGATAIVPCDRCGAPVPMLVSADVSCLYSPIALVPVRDSGDDADEPAAPIALDPPVQDFGEYDGVALSLAEVVRETLVVERPVRWRCADVSPEADEACSARWRSAAGPTADDTVDPRLAALSKFKPSSR